MQIDKTLRIELGNPQDPAKFPQNKILFSKARVELVMPIEREGKQMTVFMRLEAGDDVGEVTSTFRRLLGMYEPLVTSFPRMWHAVCLEVYPDEKVRKNINPLLHLSENKVCVEMVGGQTWTNPKADITGLDNDSAITALVKEWNAAKEAVACSL